MRVEGEKGPLANPSTSCEIVRIESQQTHGEWLTVTHKKRNKSQQSQPQEIQVMERAAKGSRFRDLIIESDSHNQNVTEDILHQFNGKSIIKGN